MDLQIKKKFFTNNNIIKGNVIKEQETIEVNMSKVTLLQCDNKKSDFYHDYDDYRGIFSEPLLYGSTIESEATSLI